MGLFGIGEVLSNLEVEIKQEVLTKKVTHILPTLQDWIESKWAIVRGSIIGFFIGILPGGSATLASFVSYAVEKRCSKTPEKFGTGMIAGVAGPESANNSATGGAFVPLLTLGIPTSPVMAILLGAMMIHGVQIGPMLIQAAPGFILGRSDQYVYWKCYAAGPQSTAHWTLGPSFACSLRYPLSSDSSLLPYRLLQSE